jgi:hypothetical protein
MNKLIERYSDKNLMRQWVIKSDKLLFDKKEDFISYLSHLTTVNQLGSFVCEIAGIKYLLEVEPWAAGCLNDYFPYNGGLSDVELNKRVEQVYLKAHKKRLQLDPDDAGYLVGIALPGLEDTILGISYALVRIDETNYKC